MNTILTDDGVRLAYRIDGPDDAPPLLFLTSLGTDLGMWDAQTDALRSHYRIIRYDLRGHGQSSVRCKPYALDRLGRDALALLDQLGIERAHVCGLSLGGITALWLAILHPERLQRAIFANTAARIGTAERWNARIEAVRGGGMAAIRDVVLARFLSPGFRAAHPAATQRIGNMLLATHPDGYIAACAALRDADLRAEIGSISVPSLIIAGELDESTPLPLAEELHTAIQGSELVIFPGVAHLSNIEQPATFTAHLLRFLTIPAGRKE